jgi:Leucine-rich repeat (LRR) protein
MKRRLQRNPNLILRLLSLSIAAGLSSCGPRFNDSTIKIIGGGVVPPGKLRNVVAIMRDELTVCSGTLIGPDLVLTAAHCFERWQHSSLSELTTFHVVAKNGGLPSELDRRANIVELEIHPRFWKDPRGAMDFAWLRIDPPFSDILPAEVPLSHLEMDDLLVGQSTAIISGYGLSTLRLPGEGEPPPIGVKRQGVSPINFRTGVEMFAGNHEVDSCSGDSGGPAFIVSSSAERSPERIVLAGVTSRGPMPCASDYESGAYGLVSEAVCWLRASANFESGNTKLQDFCFREVVMGADEPRPDSVVVTRPFTEACVSQRLSESERHDLRELFRFANIDSDVTPANCRALGHILDTVTTIDLSSRHLRQLSWLRFAKHLESLDASDNLLVSTEPLSLLTKLKKIDLRNNAIRDLAALAALSRSAVSTGPGRGVLVLGLHTQASNFSDTEYRAIASRGAAAPQNLRSLTIVLRDMLASGNVERKSWDLAQKRQLDISSRQLRSLQALRGLENLEVLSVGNNPDIRDWDVLLSLPRLHVLRYAREDHVPREILEELGVRGVTLISTPIPE